MREHELVGVQDRGGAATLQVQLDAGHEGGARGHKPVISTY